MLIPQKRSVDFTKKKETTTVLFPFPLQKQKRSELLMFYLALYTEPYKHNIRYPYIPLNILEVSEACKVIFFSPVESQPS